MEDWLHGLRQRCVQSPPEFQEPHFQTNTPLALRWLDSQRVEAHDEVLH